MKNKKIFICSFLIIVLIFSIVFIYQNNDKKEMKSNTSELISFYVETKNNEYERTNKLNFPTENYVLNEAKSYCENNSTLKWKNNKIQLFGNKSDKCYVYFDNIVKNYEYTGTSQEFIVPVSGTYKIELWGASGGNASGFRENYGGKGVYISGEITLDKNTQLFIYVGGKGEDAKTEGKPGDGNARVAKGGYNGGGNTAGRGQCCGAGGGGATHIAFSDGLLKDFVDKQDELLLVAAGGGGASRDFNRTAYEGHGGSGGIYNGYDGNTAGNKQCLAYGATRTSGGLSCNNNYKGLFGTAYTFDESAPVGVDGGAGGSGFYAGGTATCSGGGGGSSYVSDNYEFENLLLIDGDGYQWLNETKYNKITGMPSPNGETEVGHIGNGYVRITYLGNSKDYDYTGTPQEFIAPVSGKYKIELWGASGGNASGFRENYGGKGVYIKSDVTLDKNTKLFIYVGGKGEDAKTEGKPGDGNARVAKGGYNGGGNTAGRGQCCGAGGGGATHIAFSDGLLKEFANNQDELLLVAAGGGGASRDFNRTAYEGHGGSGGIYNGYDGNTAGNKQCLAYGATRTSGGLSCNNTLKGLFGTAYTFDESAPVGVDGGAGGSGFYAGGTATCSGGGGGSSYISDNYEFENLLLIDGEGYQWINETKYNKITGMPSPNGETEVGHIGNGYVRITYLGK